MAGIDASFVQQVLDIPQRQRKADVQHRCQTDNLGAGFEISEGAALCHPKQLADGPGHLEAVLI